MGGYGQFCPVSRAAEILTERWTPLIVRELLCGSTRFNALHRGVPRISSSLLARRLKELEDAGILERKPAGAGPGSEYHLTPAGRDLAPILEDMGRWAQRWVRDDLVADENLDPDLLMWDVRRRAIRDGADEHKRHTVHFELVNPRHGRNFYWLVFERGTTDLCLKNPGFEVQLSVSSSVKTLTEIWLGHVTLERAIRDGLVQLEGPRRAQRAFKQWFTLSAFAPFGYVSGA